MGLDQTWFAVNRDAKEAVDTLYSAITEKEWDFVYSVEGYVDAKSEVTKENCPNYIKYENFKESIKSEEIYYHRKVPALQSWFEGIYREQGGTDKFNCVDIEVTESILDRLQVAVTNKTLDKDASGFFWGSHDDEYHYPQIQAAIDMAREYLNTGHAVFYTSWW